MFMVGSRMTNHFKMMGLDTIGKVANTPIDKLKLMMRRKMGKNYDVNAEMYSRIANGIDYSHVTPETHGVAPKSIGNMITLPHDYRRFEEIKVVLLEITEIVCQRARNQGYMGHVVSVSCMGSSYDFPTGFNRQLKLIDPTNITNQVFTGVIKLFKEHWDGLSVRKVGISLSKLESDSEYQISLLNPDQDKLMALEKVTDAIKNKYGETSIMRAVSITEAGQALRRAEMIGGHYK